MISVPGGRFPRGERRASSSLEKHVLLHRFASFVANELCTIRFLRGLTWTRFSRWKDIGRTVIRPISLRRVTAGALVFSPPSTTIYKIIKFNNKI